MNLDVEVREIDRTEVFVADEAFFCGTGVQIAAIGTGLLVLLGVEVGDDEKSAEYLAKKIAELRYTDLLSIFFPSEKISNSVEIIIRNIGSKAA